MWRMSGSALNRRFTSDYALLGEKDAALTAGAELTLSPLRMHRLKLFFLKVLPGVYATYSLEQGLIIRGNRTWQAAASHETNYAQRTPERN